MTGGDATADARIDWLLAVDPAIAWQVRRDLLGEPPAAWRPDRARVETQGWGARLLAHQDPDGQWAGGAFVPAGFTPEQWAQEGQPWTATTYALTQLRELGLDPGSERARRTVELVGRHARWDHDGQPFWAGEVEECINGRTVADGAYFGVDVGPIVTRLLADQQPDGGWNCERAAGSVRSSFDTTINVLEGLWQHELATGGTAATRAARAAGEEYLLARGLFRRLSTGEPADPAMFDLLYPARWHFTVLRGLDHFRATGSSPDPRLGDAIERLLARRRPDGRWPLDRHLAGRVWFGLDDGPGRPSPWITLLALRVLRWWAN
ncbi:squalene cyclase [Nakamurella sp.]|uniref:squalene cyclase n=1 Tax=Nakamurella sp. TaxID=1869182 RepID=UPI003B3ACBE7